MKTVAYLSSATASFPHFQSVPMSNTKQYVELKEVPCNNSSIVRTTKVIMRGGGRV